MKTTVTEHMFRDAFYATRANDFSYEGMGLLFDYFEELEAGVVEEMELDVIDICGEYSEDSIAEIISKYSIELDCEPDELAKAVQEWVNDRTMVVGKTPDGNIVYQEF